MGDISQNFSRSEFVCKCGCGLDSADIELVSVLEWLRSRLAKVTGRKVRVSISSGNRCETHNENEGGVDGSKHIYCIAADFKCFYIDTGVQVDPVLVANELENEHPHSYGIGRYYNRTHLDVRADCARWKVS